MKMGLIAVALCISVCLLWASGVGGKVPKQRKRSKWHHLRVGGMSLDWRVVKKKLLCRISAPTRGWLALGFNASNRLKGANLLMMRVRRGRVEAEDQYITAPPVHVPDRTLGGRNDISDLSGQEKGKKTTIRFAIPLDSGDRYDLKLRAGGRYVLILAYSTSDDFGHHSIMRRHVAWRLKP